MRKTNSNVKVVVNDLRNNGGEYKWQVNAVNRIKALFDIYDLDKSGVNVEIIVNSSEIVVKAEHNGVKYSIDTPITPKSSQSKIDNTVGYAFDALSYVLSMVVCEQEEINDIPMLDNDEYDTLGTGAIEMFNDYMRSRIREDFESEVMLAKHPMFADSETECISMDFEWDYDIEKGWIDYIVNMDDLCVNVLQAREFYKEHEEEFIDLNDICEMIYDFETEYEDVHEIEDNCCGSCIVWVENPYYVAEEQEENISPCLDEYDDNEWSDRDLLIKNTADTIKDYLGNYMPSYLDQFGDCVISVYWDEFDEDMMKNMIEDDNFALQVKSLVYGVDGIKDFLVYDDGVYVSVDYDRMFNKVA